MGRLQPELLLRIESLAVRALDVVDALEAAAVSRRVLDQLTGCGTAVGANVFEADEALSRADFCKCIGIALKELSETLFWLRIIAHRRWIEPSRLDAIQAEAAELKRVLGAILSKTRQNNLARERTR
ncbi:MAG: four helix bundle protein [Phycisphaerales bacterium]|jgi:four helix bundle protein|nr:four helix bundle protein [Phycisphaerales bacterium]